MNKVRARTVSIAAGACALAALVATPSAQAAVTASNITTPADVTYLMYNKDNPNTFAISGTSNGTTGDHVDIRCYDGDGGKLVAGNVALQANGYFSVPSAPLSEANTYRVCHLHAVPAGTTPPDPSPFAGPRVLVGQLETYKVSGGPNNGDLYDFYSFAQQLQGGFDYDSLASCGIDDSYLLDSHDSLSAVPFYCNGWLTEGGNLAPTRSQLRIDGANAYPVTAAEDINKDATGLPVLHYSYSLDKKTGDFVIHDTENLVKCANATWPPTTVSCATFVSTGVTDHRTITQDHAGRVVWITDVFTSTNGYPHTLDLLWQNDQHMYGNGSGYSALNIDYKFPGQSSYSTHVVSNSVSLPNSPGTILVQMHGAADGDTHSGRAAIVYDRTASAAAFNNITSSQNDFTLHQKGKIPAHGSTRFRFAYVQAFTQANVNSLAQHATAVFKGCTVPRVAGKPLAAAKRAITRAHCTVGRISHASSTSVAAGDVISSKPNAGAHVDYHARVGLVVSTG